MTISSAFRILIVVTFPVSNMMFTFVKALSMASMVMLVAMVSSLFVYVFPYLMTIIILVNFLDNNAGARMTVGIAIVTP